MLYNHVGSNLSTSWGDGGGNGLVSVEYTFDGETAHSAGAPWRGRSALDAVELMNAGWNYRREHLRLQQRSHYVITNGGDQPNVVPRNAAVWYYFRETTYEGIKNMWEIGDKMAEGRLADDQHQVVVARARLGVAVAHEPHARRDDARRTSRRWDCRPWTDADVQLAKATQKELGVPETGLATRIADRVRGRESQPDEDKRGGGSDDIGDISWTVPTVSLSFPANFQAGPGHNWANAIAMATPIAHKGTVAGRARAGDDAARSPDAPRRRRPGARVLRQGADEGAEVHAAAAAAGSAGDSLEQGDHGPLPARDAEVLLRPDEVQDLPRSAGHQVPDGARNNYSYRAVSQARLKPGPTTKA